MSARTFVDTNVFVYLFDRDAPAKRGVARGILEGHGGSRHLTLSTQVLQEFYVIVTRKLGKPLPYDQALEATQDLAALPMVLIDPEMVLAAIDLSGAHQLSFWDALILKAAQRAGCTSVLSEDLQDGFRLGDLQVENPFRER
jgi:predicted nucleic acid-binding protein